MNIKELYYYHDLVRTKNFSQVAADFNISQPTVTMAIKRLEESFGTTFFMRDRSHHQLTVTSTGLQFDQHVQRIIEELEIAQKELARAKQERISFGLPPIIGSWYFPRFTPALLQAGLLNQLEVVDHGSASLLQLLAKGELDLALLGSLQPFQQPSLRARVIDKAPIRIIVAKDHPLAAFKDGVSFAQAAQYPFITLDDEYVHAQAFRQAARLARVRPKIVFKTSDVQILKALVANNSGISFLTDLALDDNDGLAALPLTDGSQPEFIISLAARANRLLTPNAQRLWSILETPLYK
ncbi:LysR family transcriptional regulator [Limosilactobacillus mucosae]|jgi:DNA-binding transcriptional LysR family regulator|uniref:LysR family transcriptional regulator n=1 Tax=Limosilactobacillus mucosae TaxID=97478 RepID=UPI000FFC2A0A|nr:LysR family transcriptional regulator [Limosilactobacillus mucosae]MCI1525831.1 LysR family transcriptional regulator [Limosilactobacillus mucosae]MDY5413374.1 LysR family transcriptional regulator [Limosilactobacillus mucosae]RXA55490.1 LysR family transcriptional regulator [Limosilactobacillus mucosae]UNL61770.1 LysR family transcriptional regulator [Limosilactobacillus mucosae]